MKSNIDRMREFDRAWNERRWGDVGNLLSEKLAAHVDWRGDTVGRDAYLEAERAFCDAYPDVRLHLEPYVSIFASADGRRTASIVRVTGTCRSAGQPGGPPRTVGRPFDVRVSVVCAWTNGIVAEQYRSSGAIAALLAIRHAAGERHEGR
ncbi:ester cyclase [Luteimonas sp. BDR2-5]|uniref:ester cyclase n=1 Tax=Proluteimonas luteida TaxID=2878685 RepID=UPI001E30E9F0|nr:ester cyclase [Luteimonas sp. BDR2-5]MCD9026795.1 ester cyclase [Luteimonas sp. BDR2-5]